MACKTDFVRQIVQYRRDSAQNVAHIGLNLGAAGFKHWPVLAVDNLNAQPLFHHIDDQVRPQRFQPRVGLNQLIEAFAQAVKTNLFQLALLGVQIDMLLHFAILAGRVIAAARNRAFTVAAALTARQRHLQRRLEIFRDLRQLLRVSDRDQPHHHEKRHHRGHKVGVGDFPGAVTTLMFFMLALFYDNNGVILVIHASWPEVCLPAFALRTCSSSSVNDGRSVEYRVLRPNSTAICGA